MSLWVIVFATVAAATLIYRLLKLITGPSLPLPRGPRPWPIVGNLPHMGPAPHQGLAALAKTYGPLMHLRLGSVDMVVAASAAVAEQFFKVHDANFCSRPHNFRTAYLSYNKQNLVFTPNGPLWRFLRKLSTVHVFSAKAMDDFSHLRQDMFTAGSDTSSSTIEWALAELIKNPRVMVQVQEELNIVVGQDRLVTELDLPHLPYMDAVVKETLRLHPPTPLSLPRVAEQRRDPKEWVGPFEFKPERFLPGSEKVDVDVRGNNFEVLPFGAGRRVCVGMNLGIRMVQLFIATLVHAFDWELENGFDPKKLNMDEAYGLTLQRAVPLVVHPRPRLSKHVYSSSP
ncbi:unnamed protein product [Sphenostylis stenocarpa]|uniref:Cytochrome P450 n=1 Tax=Sphenostylis stenocarpa TaxID=92480 RepID=A0AA86V9U0_9FABA|nr:unnamed protein product [Sphenostylis stenocarpa]